MVSLDVAAMALGVSEWRCSFLLVVILACCKANALQCACNGQDGSCALNETCVPSTAYGLCLRLRSANSDLSPYSSSWKLACVDDFAVCKRDGAFCCDDGDLCNVGFRLRSGGFLPYHRVVRSVSEERRRQRRRQLRSGHLLSTLRSTQASILDPILWQSRPTGLVPPVPPPAEKKLRCLCSDPLLNTCRLSNANQSVCVLPKGGWCARSWETAGVTGRLYARDSCVPTAKRWLCDSGPDVMQCCNSKKCQRQFGPPPTNPTSPPTTAGTTEPANVGFDYSNSPMRCMCNSGFSGTSPCNVTKGWCYTDGLCIATVGKNRTFCVDRQSAVEFERHCANKVGGVKCCRTPCCNAVGDSSQLAACRRAQDSLPVTAVRPTPSDAPTELTPSISPLLGARRCLCTDCTSGYCTPASGVCNVEVGGDGAKTLHRSCVDTPRGVVLPLVCQGKTIKRLIHDERVGKLWGQNSGPMQCCASDDCNVCHPGYPDLPCHRNVRCKCSTCGEESTCPLQPGGMCYHNSSVARCVSPLEVKRGVCKDGHCCNTSLCNDLPTTVAGGTRMTSSSPDTAAGAAKTRTAATAATEPPEAASQDSNSSIPMEIVIVISVCVVLILGTITASAVLVMRCASSGNGTAASRSCKQVVKKCNSKLQKRPPICDACAVASTTAPVTDPLGSTSTDKTEVQSTSSSSSSNASSPVTVDAPTAGV